MDGPIAQTARLVLCLLLAGAPTGRGLLQQPPGRFGSRRSLRQPWAEPALLERRSAGRGPAGLEVGPEPAAGRGPGLGRPRSYSVTQLRAVPHEGTPWTQGLEFSEDGHLVETSGAYPAGTSSFVRLVDTDTGATVRKITDGLDQSRFVEGISQLRGHWFASTYKDHVALEYDSQFNFVRSHSFQFQGWGLARNGDRSKFLATNSSEYVLSLDPDTFEELDARPATCLGKRVPGLNELEFVDDFLGQGPALLGNLINTRLVLVLDPETAECTGTFHLGGLGDERPEESRGLHVANGIAYDKSSGNFWVTGKNWDQMFEIKVDAEEGPGKRDALLLLSTHLSALV